jgi:histidine triad (HIT) family protein
MTSPFSDLISGKDRKWAIAENEHFIAVLETKPLRLGHVVVVSKVEKDALFDLDSDALQSLLVFAKPIAKAIQGAVPCRKVGIAVIGLETRHAHLHLVPIDSADDLNFTRAKLLPSEDELQKTLASIR